MVLAVLSFSRQWLKYSDIERMSWFSVSSTFSHVWYASEVVSIAILFRCCLRDITYVDVEEGWCQGRTLRDSIANSSQAADLTVTSSQSETSVGEKFHHKRNHVSVR